MAITVTSLGTGTMGNAAQTTTLTTVSVSPAGNCALLLLISYINSSPGLPVSSITGLPYTWTQQGTFYSNNTGTMDMWTASPGASPGSGTLSINTTGAGFQAATWDIVQVTGVDPSAQWMFFPGSFVSASAPASPTNLAAVTCGAYHAAGNIVVGSIVTNQDTLLISGVIPTDGFTLVTENLEDGNSTTFETSAPLWDGYSLPGVAGGVPSPGFLMRGTSTGTYWAAFAIELLIAGTNLSAAGPPVTGYNSG